MVFRSGYNPLPSGITPKFPDLIKIDHPSAVVQAAGAGRLLQRNPLCDKNLLKGIDGVASIPGAVSDFPGIKDVIAGTGVFNLFPEDPIAQFTGIPEFTALASPEGILRALGLPTEIDPEQIIKAAVDDILNALDIENPLAELCEEITEFGEGIDQSISTEIPTLPNINSLVPDVDFPKFSQITDQLPNL